jgi:sugar-phosphatase
MRQFLCDAILFDLDGVLVDSTVSVERHWYQWANKHGVSMQEIMAVVHGRRTVDTIRLVAPTLDSEAEALWMEQLELEDSTGLVAINGAPELVKSLPAAQWAVVTSGQRVIASHRLQATGIPVPDVFITAEMVTAGKPDPECYLQAAQLLGVRPERCLVLEDAPAGIQAARAAEMSVIAVASTHLPHDLLAAQTCVASLAALRVTRLGALNAETPSLMISVTATMEEL